MNKPIRYEEEILFCESLGIKKSDLISHPELLQKDNPKYLEYLSRLEKNEPLAYIVGSQPFMGLKFFVDKNVLIPRPETELLVEEIVAIVNSWKPATESRSDRDGFLNILDIGSGSGAIAISLAKHLAKLKITAVDVSDKALEIAKRNAEENKVTDQIEFLHGNLFEPLENKKFDIIVSNPPYIPTKIIETLEPNVKDYEPREALDGGADGLDVIRQIVAQAPKYLKPSGILAIEIGFDQSSRVKELLKQNNFKDIRIIKDYAGIERIIISVNRG